LNAISQDERVAELTFNEQHQQQKTALVTFFAALQKTLKQCRKKCIKIELTITRIRTGIA
jgi:hypothetical protein